jgi:hypothetical protein
VAAVLDICTLLAYQHTTLPWVKTTWSRITAGCSFSESSEILYIVRIPGASKSYHQSTAISDHVVSHMSESRGRPRARAALRAWPALSARVQLFSVVAQSPSLTAQFLPGRWRGGMVASPF